LIIVRANGAGCFDRALEGTDQLIAVIARDKFIAALLDRAEAVAAGVNRTGDARWGT